MVSQAAREAKINVPDLFVDKKYAEKYQEDVYEMGARRTKEGTKIESEKEKGSTEYYLKMSALLSQFPLAISALAAPNLGLLSK